MTPDRFSAERPSWSFVEAMFVALCGAASIWLAVWIVVAWFMLP